MGNNGGTREINQEVIGTVHTRPNDSLVRGSEQWSWKKWTQ